jgi:predicted N-acetyltransferase YhbS
MSQIRVRELKASERELWSGLVRQTCDYKLHIPYLDLEAYEEWKRNLGALGSFWTSEGLRLAILVAEEGGKAVGLIRVLRVPIHAWQGMTWGEGEFRGEIQDLLLRNGDARVARALIRAAVRRLEKESLGPVGVSEWRAHYLGFFEEEGFNRYARSILMGWKSETDLSHLAVNRSVILSPLKSGQKNLVQDIFLSSWGFAIPTDLEAERPIIAWMQDRPVGMALPNKASGNLDFGVHVIPQFRRRHIGTALVVESLRWLKDSGFEDMYVVRGVGLEELRPEDQVAIRFYRRTGASLLREYIGLKRD